MSTHPKTSLPIIRIAKLKTPAGRDVLERVTRDGRLSKRAAKNLGVKTVKSWIEIAAASWKEATAAVKMGKGATRRAS